MDNPNTAEGSLGTLAAEAREDAPAAGPIAAPDGKAARIAAFVEQWWASHFPGSAVSRTTEAWNVAHAAKEDLKSRLEEI